MLVTPLHAELDHEKLFSFSMITDRSEEPDDDDEAELGEVHHEKPTPISNSINDMTLSTTPINADPTANNAILNNAAVD